MPPGEASCPLPSQLLPLSSLLAVRRCTRTTAAAAAAPPPPPPPPHPPTLPPSLLKLGWRELARELAALLLLPLPVGSLLPDGGEPISVSMPRDWCSAIEPCVCIALEQARQKCISHASQYSAASTTSHSVQRGATGVSGSGWTLWRVKAPLEWRVEQQGAQ